MNEQEAQLTAEIARDALNGRSRSLKVIRCCANQRGVLSLSFAALFANKDYY